jgi:glycosyltransferase involved in cell wall biosynthesis
MLQQVYGLSRPPIAVPNGIAPTPADQAGGPKGACVLATGRVWDASKNFAVLDAAAPAIRWPVRLAGDCVAPDGATALPPRNFRCLGHLGRPAVAREYAAAPVYVSPSLHEPFGLGVLDAADAGAALVLSDIATFRELWQDAALFFGPRDAAGLAGQVNRLIEDPDLRQKMAVAARDRAARYTIAETARRMLAAYGDAAAMAGAAA